MSVSKENFRRVIFGIDTRSGKVFDVILLLLIVASITILMLESVSGAESEWAGTFFILDWIITGLFTIEYALRIWTSEKKISYVFSFYGLVDFLSILPTYLSLVISGSHALAIIRVLRLLRVFRILKLGRFIGEVSKLKAAMRTSSRKIIVFLFFVLIVSVFLGTLMFMIEGRENGFTSIPRSIYWAIVTLTTVGYGDITPQTPMGQFFAMLLMITGYGVIAVPTGLVTAEIMRETIDSDAANSTRTCAQCGNLESRARAKYCIACGSELPSQ